MTNSSELKNCPIVSKSLTLFPTSAKEGPSSFLLLMQSTKCSTADGMKVHMARYGGLHICKSTINVKEIKVLEHILFSRGVMVPSAPIVLLNVSNLT